jgi:molybdate transport system substrate-binding protein
LRKLEEAGYVTTTLEAQESRPPRKLFHLTPWSNRAFLEWAQSLKTDGRSLLLEFLVKLRLKSLLLLALLGLAVGCNPARSESAGPLLVAAASDLQLAFSEIGKQFEAETGHQVTFTFGSTGILTTQIENGAPFDILAAANVSFVDRLTEQGLTIAETQQLYAQGRIALVVNRNSGLQVASLEDLRHPAVSRVAIANPQHAPYGQAAREALQNAGVWADVEEKLVFGENVSQTLQFVQTGNAPVGIVALSIAGVPEVTGTLLPAELHDPINQALAVIKGTPREETARAFIAFVGSPAGREIMKRYGFLLPGEF